MTLCLDASEKSYNDSIGEFQRFARILGLQMKGKPRIVWIVSKIHSKVRVVRKKLSCNPGIVNVRGVTFSKNAEEVNEINL